MTFKFSGSVRTCACTLRDVLCGRCVCMCHYLRVQPLHELTLCSVRLSYFLLFLRLITCLRAKKWSFVRPPRSHSPLLLPFLSLSPSLSNVLPLLHGSSTQQKSVMASLLYPDTPDGSFPKLFFYFFDRKTLSAVCYFCVTLLTSAVRVSN